MINHGRRCRCAECRAARRNYMRAYRARKRGLQVVDTAVVGSCPTPDGPVVSGVKAEIAMIPTAESRRPGLVAAALEMAAILDDRRLATTQPSACGRLVAALGELHGLAPTVRGRLKVVTEMSPAKAPS